MYNPKIARFLQEDTYLGQTNDPLSLNLYSYVYNNPIKYWDPTGHVVSEWDEANLSQNDKNDLDRITKEWETANARGDEAAKKAAHAEAEAIRNAVRNNNTNLIGSDDGYTYEKTKTLHASGTSSINEYEIYTGDKGATSSTGYKPKNYKVAQKDYTGKVTMLKATDEPTTVQEPVTVEIASNSQGSNGFIAEVSYSGINAEDVKWFILDGIYDGSKWIEENAKSFLFSILVGL